MNFVNEAKRESMFEKIIQLLEQHKVMNAVLLFAYLLLIFFGHDFFVQLSVVLMNKVTLPIYNNIVMKAIILLGAFLLLLSLYNIYYLPQNRFIKLVFFILCIFWIFIHVNTLFEMNIEVIHAIEYSVIAFLIFPFTRSIGTTLILSVPVILIDEVNQYLYLYSEYNKYFEWNDVIFDLLGSGTFLLVLNLAGVKIHNHKLIQWRKIDLSLIIIFILIEWFGIYWGYFALTTNSISAKTFFVFNRLPNPDLFWQIHSFTGARYHVLTTPEGTVLVLFTLLLFLIYDELEFRH